MSQRESIRSAVLRGLAKREFANRFQSFGAERGRVIVVALPSDSISSLSARVDAVGGSANVVAPLLDGLMAFVMIRGSDGPGSVTAEPIDGNCTVGVLIQRLIQDGGSASYAVHVAGSAHLVPTA